MTEFASLPAAGAELDSDVVIIGAGPVGMALALSLAGSRLRVRLVDARARGAWSDDPRALALAHGSRQLLERLQAWDAGAATAIREIHVSQRGGFGRTLIEASDYGAPALGYVMRYRDLAAALAARLAPEQLLAECAVESIETGRNQATLGVVQHGAARRLTTRLIVHAEGTPEPAADVSVRDYHQHAIVAEVHTAAPHRHRAWERFTADGPLALLPLGAGYSVVFTLPAEQAARLIERSDDDFLAALRERFGRRVDFVATGPRASFPLALRRRSQITQQRQVWIGNSAQTLHPVSGQGFNLGLRDAAELAEVLLDHGDPGEAAALAAHAHGRDRDRRYSMAFTDGIVRLFSNDLAPLRCARGLGLLALDLYPPLRHFVAKRMIWGARAWP